MISSFSGVLSRSTPTVQSTQLVEYEAEVIKKLQLMCELGLEAFFDVNIHLSETNTI